MYEIETWMALAIVELTIDVSGNPSSAKRRPVCSA
jgi:hypothetical protein